MSFLAAFLVTWVSYALGGLALCRLRPSRGSLRPRGTDLILLAGACAYSLWMVQGHGGWQKFLWFALTAFLLGTLPRLLPSRSDDSGLAGEYSDQPGEAKAATRSPLRRAWRAWVRFAERLGDFQIRVLFSYLYLIVLLPWGVIYRFFADPLTRRAPAETLWKAAPPREESLGEGQQQY